MTPPLSGREKAHSRALWRQVVLVVAVIALVFGVWATGYSGRWAIVHSQRRGCARNKADRRDNAAGWREARVARLATARDPAAPPRERSNARQAARRYGRIAKRLSVRGRIDCESAFPAPPILSFHQAARRGAVPAR